MSGLKPCICADALPLVIPGKPHQSNYTDFGVFLLHYAELIFADLDLFLLSGQYSKLSSWFDDNSIAAKRYDIAKIIMQVAKALSSVEADHFPDLTFSSTKNEVAEINVRLIDPD